MEKKITIFTPTYNRARTINKLYESLCNQTNNEFIWMVVDDGSTDTTSDQIREYTSQGRIDIEYIFQNNSGKYVAHNNAVKRCSTEFFVCVDSDDTLVPNAVERILDILFQYKNNDDIAGFVSPRQMVGQDSFFIESLQIDTLSHAYYTKKIKGETLIAFKTSILKQYSFPVFQDEKFMPEDVLYNQIDYRYKYVLKKEYLCVCEYQNDGISKNIKKIRTKNPKAVATSYLYKAIYGFSMLEGAKAYAAYLAHCSVCKIRVLDQTKRRKVTILRKLLGRMLYLHYYRLFRYR